LKFYTAIKFFEYLLTARPVEAMRVNSPLQYNTLIKVLRNKINDEIVFKKEMIWKKLKSDSGSILVTDYGTGSSAAKYKSTKINKVAKRTAVPSRYGEILSGFSTEFGTSGIVEFGTSTGISTIYLAAGNNEAAVTTMEGCPVLSEIAERNFREARLSNVSILTGTFEETIPQLEHKQKKYGLVFIDGNHRRDATVNYFSRMADLTIENSVIILDDIYYSREMGEAWEIIKKDKRASVTVDLFRMGIVFMTGESPGRHYKIRY
jgi:predicted O-methyltransferase YrrM